MASKPPVLSIQDLTVAYQTGPRVIEVLRGIDLDIHEGQTYGLVGESGSGKSTLAMAVMRYLGTDGRVLGGKIFFNGQDLLVKNREDMREIWGKDIALVPQNPYSSLNPSIKVGEQVAEILRLHLGMSPARAASRSVELLEMVHLPDPERIAGSFPHQLSGGQQQRVLMAMALSTEPALLVLDEPTTSLDVTTEAAILDLVRELIEGRGASTLYVTHNLGVIAGITDRVAVLYASELVEDAPTEELYRQPLHPYTKGLLDSVPVLGQRKDDIPLAGIQGTIPPLGQLPSGCVFADRCPLAVEICHQERPPLDQPLPGRRVRCHRWPEILSGEISSDQEVGAMAGRTEKAGEPVLELDGVEVTYDLGRSLVETLTGQPARQVRAVDGVSLTVNRRQTLGVVGESGSGKSSLARAVIGLVARQAGRVELLNVDLPPRLSARDRDTLRHLQMVFQNPEEALNPHLTVGESLARPMITLWGHSQEEAEARVRELLHAVRLPEEFARRLPAQLSGGEKQRVAIARAFAVNPDLLLADEPVSSLDVSVQASILNLLNSLQIENETTSIFISHDIGVVAYLADEIAVMYLGQLMEVTPAGALFDPPYHPYTEALLAAIPIADPDAKQEDIRLVGDVPSSIDKPGGCPFHTRCPRFLGDVCREQTPPWQQTKEGKRIFCHIPVEDLEAQQSPVIVIQDREDGS